MQSVKVDSWQSEVVESDIPVFVDFWAEWCGPCRMVSPTIEELAGEYAGRVKFVKVNVDDAGELASKYGIFSIPTLMILDGGKMIDQKVGASDKETYRRMIDGVLAN